MQRKLHEEDNRGGGSGRVEKIRQELVEELENTYNMTWDGKWSREIIFTLG